MTVAIVIGLLLCLVPAAGEKSPRGEVKPEMLAAAIKELLAKNLPPVLIDKSPGWGNQAETANGLKWVKKGVVLRPKVMKGERNHGKWRKIKVMTDHMPESLIVQVKNLERVDGETTRFDLYVSFDGRAEVRQQKWDRGSKWYDMQVRARFKLHLKMTCELSARWEAAKFPPELVVRMKASNTDFRYDHVKVEHVAGIGGEAAEWIGEAVMETMKVVKPSLEKDLLAKANAAVEKAGSLKEFRIGVEGVKKKRD